MSLDTAHARSALAAFGCALLARSPRGSAGPATRGGVPAVGVNVYFRETDPPDTAR